MFSKKKPKADPGPLLVWTEAGNSGHWDDSIVFPVLLLDRKYGFTEPDLEHLTMLQFYRSLDSGLRLVDSKGVSATVLKAEPLEEGPSGWFGILRQVRKARLILAAKPALISADELRTHLNQSFAEVPYWTCRGQDHFQRLREKVEAASSAAEIVALIQEAYRIPPEAL